MGTQIAPESMKMVSWQASLQRVTKKSDFCNFLVGFFYRFSIDLLVVFDVGFEAI